MAEMTVAITQTKSTVFVSNSVFRECPSSCHSVIPVKACLFFPSKHRKSGSGGKCKNTL